MRFLSCQVELFQSADEQEQMHARGDHSEIERSALVAGQRFVQHGIKLVFGEARPRAPPKYHALPLGCHMGFYA